MAEDEKACLNEKVALRERLTAVFRDFDAAPVPLPMQSLVSLDGRIRAVLADRPSYRPCGSDLHAIYDPQWQRMGVETGYWNDLSYSGQLLVEAHRRDPHSSLRRYTLFSTVFGETPAPGLGKMPDISAAFAYAKEFPEGPFVKAAYLTIADFHKDLFMVLRDRLSDFKFECYAPYIGKEPWPTQKERARQIAMDYYRRVLTLDAGGAGARKSLDETSRGVVKAWSFCSD